MAAFNLTRFRDLAFGRSPLPDHPMRDLDEARKLLQLLPEGDPDECLADLTRWTTSMNETESFTPGRRGRILMLLDDAARPHWRTLGIRYLAPQGRPTENRDGDPGILRALFDSASEFANGFAIALDTSAHSSRWVVENQARLFVRSMRWLGRRLALAHMLRLPHTFSIWEQLHRRQELARLRGLERSTLPAFEGVKYNTSVNREYLRALLLELAAPDSIRPRNVELIYRIAARIATAAKLEDAPNSETGFAVIPAGDARPIPLDRLKPGAASPIYISTANCLPRLRAALERDMGRDQSDEDTLYGRGFTLRERSAMLTRLLDYWGLNPPQRRAPRVPLALAARIVNGFEKVVGVVPPMGGERDGDAAAARKALHLKLDETTRSLKRSKVKGARVGLARVVDASAGGLGLGIRSADATWAEHGALVAVLLEPGKEWFVGVLRRIFSVDEELRLGIQILAAKPKKVMLRAPSVREDSPWEEATRVEKRFKEVFRQGIVLEAQSLPLAAGEMLLPPGLASRGDQFNVPMADKQQRLHISRLHVDNEHFQRVLFEPLGVT
jgi:hypothetical protein